jgi:formylglycine-generating enzyme required for sulfatase activity
MIIIPGPVEFVMGSPETEEGRTADERQRRRRIGRTFAIASKEVTVEEFDRFAREVRGRKHGHMEKYSPEARVPKTVVTWYDAAAYCRWLSAKEGIAEDQMCYPPIEEIKEGMKLPSDYLSRNGYRLPTQAEWEYACRAGTSTSRYYGRDVALLGKYAWYSETSQGRLWPVGSLKPNDFGLFDMLGGAGEWGQESSQNFPLGTGSKPIEDIEDTATVSNDIGRMARGGGAGHGAASQRSARRGFRHPTWPLGTGLRPARTYP